jgi:hypothetical protein
LSHQTPVWLHANPRDHLTGPRVPHVGQRALITRERST